VSVLDRDEALEICERIKARHPDILERRPDGLYRFLVGGEDQRQALFDYLAGDRVAAAHAKEATGQGRGPGAGDRGGRTVLSRLIGDWP
jgi:hypothetical protein